MTSLQKGKELDSGESKEQAGAGRRWFLKVVGVATLIASIPSSLWAFFIDKLGIRTVEKDTFVFELPKKSVFWKLKKEHEPYFLIIDGLATNKCRLTFQELMKLPQCPLTYNWIKHIVSNFPVCL